MYIKRDLTHLAVGDRVERFIGGLKGMPLIVAKVENGILSCTLTKELAEKQAEAIQSTASIFGVPFNGDPNEPIFWDFLAETGLEIDEDLGWDGKTKSGSYIKEMKNADTQETSRDGAG